MLGDISAGVGNVYFGKGYQRSFLVWDMPWNGSVFDLF